ncbi:hypothetical protein PI124_g18030 [Phytophthora idaei]|nr:hypothetical protein PI125_g19481 [Phytophthora idaei]KAG3161984.1 hypothetical protein PI126_g6188 [Phytophthora idaei]KAG3236965.1 hypothetical protein PI124_g18030 [Phytophthora idaei]
MPVEKSKQTKAQAKALPVIHPRDADFGHLWRQLPNARKDPHVEGASMFIGELAVGPYAIAERLISANADSYDVTVPEEPEEPAAAEGPEQPVEAESVTASQIDTSVALSAKPVDDLFGPEIEESEDDGERTQHIEGPNPENEVRLSQIDTRLALSANTIDDILRGEINREE